MKLQRFIVLLSTLLLLFSSCKKVSTPQLHDGFFTYCGDTVILSPHCFFIDGSLSDAEVNRRSFVFTSLQEAVKYVQDGTEEQPMRIYIAPWVYWLDNPDDQEVRVPIGNNSVPFGMEIDCEYLQLCGLASDASDVVLASNRGQTIGAKGNFTMINFKGDGLHCENITFGNYCNIDLHYKKNPALSRTKRASAIVQAQLAFSNGDKVMARNCNFVSRLNLAPFWGSKRTLFDHCHFESTDDALNGSAVYLNCDFDFYSSMPFGGTSGTGAVLLNCDVNIIGNHDQYFTKVGGQIGLVDVRFYAEGNPLIKWNIDSPFEARSYQHHVLLNGKSIVVDEQKNYPTKVMDNKEILAAYKVGDNYNTYNLLCGDDDWDPMGVKSKIDETYRSLAVQLTVSPTRQLLETGKDEMILSAKAYRFGNYEQEVSVIAWQVADEFKDHVKLFPQGNCCRVIPTNQTDDIRHVIITAATSEGLEAAAVVNVAPAFLPAPEYKEEPKIAQLDGSLQLDYELNTPYSDQSLVRWYRCADEHGENAIEIAVSRFNKPLKNYALSLADVGHFIKVEVQPKHQRCHAGEITSCIFDRIINAGDVLQDANLLTPDIIHMSTQQQSKLVAGVWCMDSFAPIDTKEWAFEVDSSQEPWYVGTGVYGASLDTGLVQNAQGARLRYQPINKGQKNMNVSFTAVPSKTAGQGFSSARMQYMDVAIKMDLEHMTGYALRLIRTTKYGDAIDFILMKYNSGFAEPISEPISANCFRGHCRITLSYADDMLTATASQVKGETPKHVDTAVQSQVHIHAKVEANEFNGFSIQHTGSVGSGATLLKDIVLNWE